MNNHKASISDEFNKLDLEAESRALSDVEKSRMKELSIEINRYWALEEIKIRQSSRDRNIVEGDRNTSYFQAVANCLMGPVGLVYNSIMLKIVVDFHKSLFGKEETLEVKLNEGFWDESEKVTEEDNAMLQAPFSQEKIKEALFSCYAEGAPGPDGLSFLVLPEVLGCN